jgi:hypothetical protein
MAKKKIVRGFFDRGPRIILNGKHRPVCPLVDIPTKAGLVLGSSLLVPGLFQCVHQRRHQNVVPRFYHKLPDGVQIYGIVQVVFQTELLADNYVSWSVVVRFHLVHVPFLAFGTTTALY